MRTPLYVVGFLLVLSVAGLSAQTTPQQQQTTPVSPSTPATRIGDGAQTKAGTPAPSATVPPATGGVAGATSSSTTQAPGAQEPVGGVGAMTDSDLESQIENALSKEPTLTGNSARVHVSGDTVELTGTVGTNKEKVTATRIVQSYTGSKKLVNKLTVGGRSEKAPAQDGRSTANPANNPEPGKGTPRSSSKPPQE